MCASLRVWLWLVLPLACTALFPTSENTHVSIAAQLNSTSTVSAGATASAGSGDAALAGSMPAIVRVPIVQRPIAQVLIAGNVIAAAAVGTVGVGAVATVEEEVDQPCSPTCDSPKVCLRGRCECPVLLEGARCEAVRNYTAALQWNPFSRPLPFNYSAPGLAWETVGVRAGKHGPASQLGEHIDLARCAVVGSGHSLLRVAAGDAIDAHTAVIRLNEAPARQRAKSRAHVGAKTSLRLQNGQRCGYSDSTPRELCLGFGWTGINCVHWKTSRCKIIKTPQWMDEWFHRYWILNPPPKAILKQEPKFDGRNRPMSGGFAAVMLALSVCGEVDLYGFSGGGGNHYYPKLTAIKDGCTPFNINTHSARRSLLASRPTNRHRSPAARRRPPLSPWERERAQRLRHSQRPGGPKKSKEQKRCLPPKHWSLKHFFRTEAHALALIKTGLIPRAVMHT